jgi:hypothetical protein
MKTREFTIDTHHLDLDYGYLTYVDFIEEYIELDLEVPNQYIELLDIKDTYVNIKLSKTREYFNDDWYINLQRVA